MAGYYQQLFDRALEACPEQQSYSATGDVSPLNDSTLEAARNLLFDKEGPFKLPVNPVQFYPPETTTELELLKHKLQKLEASRPELELAMGVTEGPEIGDMRLHHRGSYFTPGHTVPRGFLQVISDGTATPIDGAQSGRLQLAKWLTNPHGRARALTARVIVNRIWHWHFGTGIVPSTANFGNLGEQPSNRPLLDYLAEQFMNENWSIKAMHRLMMNSAAYQMSTAHNPQAAMVDPENKLFWHMSRRRLEAEAVRDILLALGGTLDRTMGGTLLRIGNRNYVTSSGSSITDEYNHPRRSVYLPVVRSAMYEPLTTFDFPDPALPSGHDNCTSGFIFSQQSICPQSNGLFG